MGSVNKGTRRNVFYLAHLAAFTEHDQKTAAIVQVNYRPVLSSERAPQDVKAAIV
jgi:hypothetical protein